MANQYDAIYGVGWYDYAKYNFQNLTVSIDSLYVISIPSSKTIVSDYHIRKATSQTLTQDAEIILGRILFSNYHLKKLGVAVTVVSDALIKKASSGTITSDAQLIGIVSVTISSDAIIFVAGQNYLVSNYYIGSPFVRNIYSDAHVKQIFLSDLYLNYTLKASSIGTIISNYYLKETNQITVTQRAHILGIPMWPIVSDYSVFRTYTQTITTDSQLTRITKPTLIDPPDGTVLPGWPPVFTWYIPPNAAVGGSDIHCGISFAYDFAFTNQIGLYTTFRTDANATFEYQSGSSWLPYPITGLPLASQGTNARATITNLPGGTKYWRVRLCRK